MTRGWALKIISNDQGSQFTDKEFTGVVLAKGCEVSMDGLGLARRRLSTPADAFAATAEVDVPGHFDCSATRR